jgi:hypothetical protein
MTLTNYKIKKERESFTVTENGKVISKGFTSEDAALHSIFVINGRVHNHFYINEGSDVYLKIKSNKD